MRTSSAGSSEEKRKSLPRLHTGARKSDMQSRLLESASAAVADALGIDPRELPQPFNDLSRTQSSASTVYTPSDATWSQRGSFVQGRLATAIADVLGLEAGEISPGDSFVELGGDQQTAAEFSETCKTIGLSIHPDDVLACPTIAELETLVAPLATSRTNGTASPIVVSPLSTDFSVDGPSRHEVQVEQPPFVPPKAPTRLSRVLQQRPRKLYDLAPTQYRTSSSYHDEAEYILSLNQAVSRAVVVRPKAGPFEGQAVAFLILVGYSNTESADCEVMLQDIYDNSRVQSARKAVEVEIPLDHTPKVWVVLEQIPLDEYGNINRRKLQTWIQNINAEVYAYIMSNNPKDHPVYSPYEPDQQDHASAELASVASSDEVLHFPRDNSNQSFDLSSMQRLYFHTAMGRGVYRRYSDSDQYRFNQSVLLRLKKPVDVEDVHAAVEAVVGHHSMLRCRFRPDFDSWCQWIEPEISASYHFATHAISTDDEVEEIISLAQGTIDIEHGPVFAAHHFHTHDGYQMLYLIAHRLAVDLKSWPVIADDLDELLANGYLTSWGSLSFPSWIAQQRQHIESLGPAGLVAFQTPPPLWDFWGIQDDHNTYGNAMTAGFTIDAELASVLSNDDVASKIDCSDIFIAALLLSFSRTFRDRPVPTLWNQEHERATLETGGGVSKTVGWFNSICPLALDISHSNDIFTAMSLVKDAHNPVAAKGVPYFAASLSDAESASSFVLRYCPMELVFTFAGDMKELDGQNGFFEQISVPGGSLSSSVSDIGPGVGRISAFEISAVIDRGEIKFKFLYNRQSRHQDLIQRWIDNCKTVLSEALRGLKSPLPGLSSLNQKILPTLNLDPTNVMAMYPATQIQQTILISESLTPGSSNVEVIYEFDPSNNYIDIGRICAAWQRISDRHSVLRTIFIQSVSRTGLYDQLVLHRHSPSMLFLESKSNDTLMKTIDKTPSQPWADGTPWHRLIVCHAPRKMFLKLEASQAICDHASLIILFKELETAYLNINLPEPSRFLYQEYLTRLKATSYNISFWREQLNGCQPCLFPTLTTKDANTRKWKNTIVDLPIPREHLAAFAVKQNIDVSAVLQVAWALVLRDYVGSDDVCFGYRVAGRSVQVDGVKEAVGCFSTTLVCRLYVPASHSISPVLQGAHERHREASYHQNATVNQIQHALGIKGQRIFNTCMSFGSLDMITELSPKNKFRYVRSKLSSECDLSIDVNLHARKISVDIGQRILNRSQITTISQAFCRAIQIISQSPDSLVKEVDLFSEHDHEQILAWNSMSQPSLCDQPIHKLISRQASTNPDAQAVCAWDGDFTFAELHERSIALAGHLLTSGLEPQTPVPVIVDKSRWAVVAMLAVLHANAILVPVDSEANSLFPWIIEAVGARAVLASDSVRGDLDSVDLDLVIVNEYTVPAMSAQAAAANPAKTKSADVACILFEHDSPETKKGIAYSHRTLAAACTTQGPALRICFSSRVMQLSSYSVDIALSEIFTTLVNGGCVCIPSASERLTSFTDAARRMRVNWSFMTPELSRKLNPQSLLDLAVVCFRTQYLDADIYNSWAGQAKVFLTYGPPDTFPLGLSAAEVKDVNTTQCIGSPFCGNFWIVSQEDHSRLVPVGAMGELIIGSPTLAKEIDLKEVSVGEWIQRISAASNSGPGDCDIRLLNMGQLVRYREEGQIELALSDDRADQAGWSTIQQLEIECALRRCLGRGIDVAVEMVSFEDLESTPILTAFVELDDNLFHLGDLSKLGRVTKTKERIYLIQQMADMALRETVPSHMIPSAYIPVKKLPLTPSLEVDRGDLHKLVARLSKSQLLNLTATTHLKDYALEFKPLTFTETEKKLRGIWASVLELPESSIKGSDRFLSLGGDAVLAQSLVVACREKHIIVSIVDVLRNISLSELADGVVLMEQATGSDELITQSDLSGVFSNGTVEGFIDFEDVAEASSLQTLSIEAGLLRSRGDVNYLTIDISGSVDRHKLETACFKLVETHSILRTGFVSRRKLLQTVFSSPPYRPEFQRHQCPGWRLGSFTTKLIRKDQTKQLDFQKPITRFMFVDAGKTSSLVLRLSGAQYNATSLPSVLRDLGRLYEHPDQPLKLYPSFCDVVRGSQNSNRSGAADYWRALLERSSMTQIIPQPSPTIPAPNSKTIRQQIPVVTVQSFSVPLHVILKGAWSIVLSSLSGSDDVVFGQLVEGETPRLSGNKPVPDVAGPLGNIVPVRTRLPDIPISSYEYLRCIQSQHTASISHQNMQFMGIVRSCTSWPAWTRFSTVVQHVDRHEHNAAKKFSLSNATCKLSTLESNHQTSDIFVRSTTLSDDTIDVSLTFCERKINSSFAAEVLEMLCSTITLLISTPAQEPLPHRFLKKNTNAPGIPPISTPRQDDRLAPVQPVHPSHTQAINGAIKAAWDSVFDLHGVSLPDGRDVPFYDVSGSLVAAAELARYYTEHIPSLKLCGIQDVEFVMEDIIEHPTMAGQYKLIISKRQIPKSRRKSSSPSRGVGHRGVHIRRITPVHANPNTLNSRGVAAYHHAVDSNSSMESMTTGSSHSDREELKDDARLGKPFPRSKKTAKQLLGVERAKSPSFMHMMMPIH